MKPQIYEPECPARLIKEAEEKHLIEIAKFNYRRYEDIIWQEERDGLLYTYIHNGREVVEEGILTPQYLIVADMENRRWDTYSFQDRRLGQKTIRNIACGDPAAEYIDRDRYGTTLHEMQKRVLAEEREKREKRKRQQIQENMDRAEKLPAAFLPWSERQLPSYIVYEPGDNHRGYCTRCKRETRFTSRLLKDKTRTCPHCRSRCRVKTPKTLPEMTGATTAYIQRTHTGIMVRFIRIYREMREKYKNSEPEISERLRIVVDRGKRQNWYEKRGYEYGDESWYRNNVDKWEKHINSPHVRKEYFRGYIVTNKAGPLPVYKRNILYVIQDSSLRYVDDWMDMLYLCRKWKDDLYNFIDLYEYIHSLPQIESLWKLGFRRLAVDIMRTGSGIRENKKEIHKFLGISKDMWRYLQNRADKNNILMHDIKAAGKYDGITPDKDLAWEAARRIPSYYREDMKGLPLRKLLGYLSQNEVSVYGDYLHIARGMGYDLRDDFVAFPKDLKAAHDAALEVREEAENRRELEDARKDDPGIRKVCRKIRREYTDEIKGYLFRPAGSNYEIVKEGQALHHCVGMGTYKKKMLEGRSYIIFMRKKESPDESYYTIEISPEGRILQTYGKYNQKPDWDTVGPVITQYTEKVRERLCQKASCRKTGHAVTGAAQTA